MNGMWTHAPHATCDMADSDLCVLCTVWRMGHGHRSGPQERCSVHVLSFSHTKLQKARDSLSSTRGEGPVIINFGSLLFHVCSTAHRMAHRYNYTSTVTVSIL